jgi:ligand-binding sensor domain-containing protein
MKKTITLTICICMLGLIQAQTENMIKVNENTNITWYKFTTTDGLPSNAIKDILFDKNGILWIATTSGVSKYNGTTFQNYTTADGLHSNAIGRLYCDNQNRIWAIGDYSAPGLSIYNGTWQAFNKNSSVPKPGFLFQDADNNIYITEGEGKIFKYNGIQVDSVAQTPDKRISSAIFDQNGIMWVVSGEKLLKYSGSTLVETKILTSNGVGSFYLIEKDKLGKLWLIMGNSLYKSDDLANFTLLGSTWNYYMDIAFDSNNNAFFGRYSKANGGLKTYNGTTWGEYTGSNGLTSSTVQSVAIAPNDKVWAGADDGLYYSSEVLTTTANASGIKQHLFPNPATTQFSIKANTGTTSVLVSDLTAKTFIQKKIIGSENIDITSLPKGIYLVRIVHDNAESENSILIKQ